MSCEQSRSLECRSSLCPHSGLEDRIRELARVTAERDEAQKRIRFLEEMGVECVNDWNRIEEQATRITSAEAERDRLREALRNAKISHRECEDCWYSCPLSAEGCCDERQTECTCGADKHNAAIDAALAPAEPAKDWVSEQSVSHSLTCPVSQPNFVLVEGVTQCNCDFMERLQKKLNV